MLLRAVCIACAIASAGASKDFLDLLKGGPKVKVQDLKLAAAAKTDYLLHQLHEHQDAIKEYLREQYSAKGYLLHKAATYGLVSRRRTQSNAELDSWVQDIGPTLDAAFGDSRSITTMG